MQCHVYYIIINNEIESSNATLPKTVYNIIQEKTPDSRSNKELIYNIENHLLTLQLIA